jgi:hypothetical protein
LSIRRQERDGEEMKKVVLESWEMFPKKLMANPDGRSKVVEETEDETVSLLSASPVAAYSKGTRG